MQFALELANVVDTVVAGGVNLQNINVTILGDRFALRALTTWFRRRFRTITVRSDAIKRLCQDARRGCFANTTDACEQESVGEPFLGKGIAQGPHESILANQRAKVFRPVFTGQNHVGRFDAVCCIGGRQIQSQLKSWRCFVHNAHLAA